MSKIVVFDSGFGSLSIINAIQKICKANIVYFADQKNFPYGNKSMHQLNRIINNTINNLRQQFKPDMIVIASNTPSLLLPHLFDDDRLIGVYPPLHDAERITKSKSIGVLATRSVVRSDALSNYIQRNVSANIRITKIDATHLVQLVESGKFVSDKNCCRKMINSVLAKKIITKKIDTVTLSSTHLPFLLPLLKENFPNVEFLDPAQHVANVVIQHQAFVNAKKNSLRIFSSGNTKKFQKYLQAIGIANRVEQLRFEL
ncbi:MAG TPA: glutamate racemase [Candidatus Nitrosotenuis sp.]|nr:glutamate racemase [Candidatus Nitrosotenuis sp.]